MDKLIGKSNFNAFSDDNISEGSKIISASVETADFIDGDTSSNIPSTRPVDFANDEMELSRDAIRCLHEKDSEILRLKTDFSLFRAETRRTIAELRQEIQRLKQNLVQRQSELKEKLSQLDKAHTRFQRADEKIHDLQDIIRKNAIQIENDEKLIESLRSTLSALEIEKSQQVQKLRLHYEEQIEKLKSAQTIDIHAFSNLQSENYTLSWQIGESQKVVETLKFQLVNFEKQLAQQSSDMDQLVRNQQNLLSHQKENLLKEFGQDLAEHKALLSRREFELNTLREESSKLKRQIRSMEVDRLVLERQLRQRPISKEPPVPRPSAGLVFEGQLEERLKQLNEAHSTETAELKKRIATLEAARVADHQMFERERQNFAHEKSKYQKEIDYLTTSLTDIKSKDSEVYKSTKELERTHTILTQNFEAMNRKNNLLTARCESLLQEKLKAEQLNARNVNLDSELGQARSEVTELRNQLDNAVNDNARLKLMCEYTQGQLTETTKSLQDKILVREQDLQILFKQDQEKEFKLKLTADRLMQLQNQHALNSEALAQEKIRTQEIALKNEKLMVEYQHALAELKELQLQLDNVSSDNIKLQLLRDYTKDQLTEKIQSLQDELTHAREQNQQLSDDRQREVGDLKQKLAFFKSQAEEKDKVIQVIDIRTDDLSVQLAGVQQLILVKEQELQILKKQTQEKEGKLRIEAERIALTQSELTDESVALENRMSLIKQQENRLSAYSKALNRKNVEAIHHLEFLLNEYKSAEVAHPLQDYYDYIEQELVRTELELRRTPTISVDRNKLEKALSALTEQRTFIKDVIDKRREDLLRRNQKLQLMLEKTKRDLLPPPPPRPSKLK